VTGCEVTHAAARGRSVTPGRVEAAAAGAVGAVAVAVLGYRLGTGEPTTAALGATLAVLLVAVPGALRLATGLPRLVGTVRAAQLGVLFSGAEALAAARRVDTVVLAGTGTLTTGELAVHDVRAVDGVAPADVLRLAGAVAQESDRPLDRAIAAATLRLPGVAEFDKVDELGVRGIVAEIVGTKGEDRKVIAHAVLAGSAEWLAAHDIDLPAELTAASTGRTSVVVAWDGVARGVIEVGPAVAAATADAVGELGELGLRPVLLAAETTPVAYAVATRAGLVPDAIVSGVGPLDAAPHVRTLVERGARVAVIADCGRYEAALGVADLAVRIGPAAAVPHRRIDDHETVGRPDSTTAVTLACGDLTAAVDAIRLARRTASVSRGNMVWALACIAAVLPAAATGLLGPPLSAAATATGAAVMVLNSLRLQRYRATGG
jgi:P-type Cu+ transporter